MTLSIRDLNLTGKRVFMRVDFNVPLAPGGKEITSDKRIRASLPSIQYALDHGAGLILASHLGRPRGKPNPEMSLAPVAERLAQLLGNASANARGISPTVPVNWSVQYMPIRSVAAEKRTKESSQ